MIALSLIMPVGRGNPLVGRPRFGCLSDPIVLLPFATFLEAFFGRKCQSLSSRINVAWLVLCELSCLPVVSSAFMSYHPPPMVHLESCVSSEASLKTWTGFRIYEMRVEPVWPRTGNADLFLPSAATSHYDQKMSAHHVDEFTAWSDLRKRRRTLYLPTGDCVERAAPLH